ncbi:MAG: hypothetical protein O3B22_07940 [Proteobacteria bacterium]|nr:hypothetical protein [Pseudomonadota bacterium]MDA1070585.1 hypothetical protein [Pseudomonadota bacterium]
MWLQASVLATAGLFAVVFTILADHVLPPIEGLRPSVLLIDTAICLPAVILGLACAMWPAHALLPRLGLDPLVTSIVAPLAGTATLSLTATGFIVLWTGSMLDELVSHPGLTVLAMVLAGPPAMVLAQTMIWPWGHRAAPTPAEVSVS